MEPNTHRSYGPHSGGLYNDGRQFYNHAGERLRILGEIPLRKFAANGAPILDPEGNPDTSFMARIPADTPFTFQMIDEDGLALTMAQTWHQVRPGEVRNNCGGCHAHSQPPLPIANTVAGQPNYQPVDLTKMVTLLTRDGSGATILKTDPPGAVNVEFLRDIRPVLQRSCLPCHSATNAPGGLVLDDYASYNGLPGDYARLADDSDARWGFKPVISTGTWRQSNASRYIRMFQSRRSLLIWKIFGRRMDGWTNADHPTESVPGNATTLPSGADPNSADLDYTGTLMPPTGSGVPQLSEDEKMRFARWIDLGCPINTGTGSDAAFGWFLDDVRPTLTVSRPRQNQNGTPLNEIRIGVSDANSGISNTTLSVIADFPVNGAAPGAELAGQGTFINPGIFSIPLQTPIGALSPSHITAAVSDAQGNRTTLKVRFWIDTGFHITSIDTSQLGGSRLVLRFENPTASTNHAAFYTDDPAKPRGAWAPLTLLNPADEPNQIRRVEIQLPAAITNRCFIRVQRN